MSFNKKTLMERIFKITKATATHNHHNNSLTNCRISTSAVSVRTRIPRNPDPPKPSDPDPGDAAMFRRLFHNQAATAFLRESLMAEKLGRFNIAVDRIRLDGLAPPPPPPSTVAPAKAEEEEGLGLTAEHARKLYMVAQIEVVKARLKEVGENWIAKSDFDRIVREVCSDLDQANRVSRALDDSGTVVVLGDVVLLKPEKVMKAIGGLIPLPQRSTMPNLNDPRRRELQELEILKSEINMKANALVRREMWLGLTYLVIQTAAFMRLTFWELTWDVMEPICFYITSMYFMAGYAFFLRTSKEPSFEGFYQSRFAAKQKQLMKAREFDLERYNELRRAFYLPPSEQPSLTTKNLSFDQVGKVC